MTFAALDLHKKVVEAITLGNDGNVIHRDRFAATREALTRFAKQHLSPETRFAVEATTNTWPVVELLRPYVAEVVARKRTSRVFALAAWQPRGGGRFSQCGAGVEHEWAHPFSLGHRP